MDFFTLFLCFHGLFTHCFHRADPPHGYFVCFNCFANTFMPVPSPLREVFWWLTKYFCNLTVPFHTCCCWKNGVSEGIFPQTYQLHLVPGWALLLSQVWHLLFWLIQGVACHIGVLLGGVEGSPMQPQETAVHEV